MKVIGLRAEKDTVHWAIVDGTSSQPVLVKHDKLVAPKDFLEAAVLSWFRIQIQNLLKQHLPDVAAVRLSETFLSHKPKPNVLASMFSRARIEGVILSTISDAGIRVESGTLAMVRSELGSKSAKAYLDKEDMRGLDWSKIKNEKQREAILFAVPYLGE